MNVRLYVIKHPYSSPIVPLKYTLGYPGQSSIGCQKSYPSSAALGHCAIRELLHTEVAVRPKT